MGQRGRRRAAGAAVWLILTLCLVPGARAAGTRMLVPVGETVGIRIPVDGVIVVGPTEPEGETVFAEGDRIVAVDGARVGSGEELARRLAESGGDPVTVTVIREGRETTVEAAPWRDGDRYVLGVWARDCVLGLGTVTYYDPDTGDYGALGHPVSDSEAGDALTLEGGGVYCAEITGVIPSVPGTPGQIRAEFSTDAAIGTTEENTPGGLFGAGCGALAALDPVPAASESEIHTGEAQLLSDVAGEGVRSYDVEITRIYGGTAPENRSMLLTVTDGELLALTGGIVQGMSGCPILQDGQLVGAVSHVRVNSPGRGYAVSLEDMLAASAGE